ncbi:hypothetical protein OROHE_019566 [Orobanche hederae]
MAEEEKQVDVKEELGDIVPFDPMKKEEEEEEEEEEASSSRHS